MFGLEDELYDRISDLENEAAELRAQLKGAEARVDMFERLITICSDRNEVIPKSVLRVSNRPMTPKEMETVVYLVEKYGWDRSGAKVELR